MACPCHIHAVARHDRLKYKNERIQTTLLVSDQSMGKDLTRVKYAPTIIDFSLVWIPKVSPIDGLLAFELQMWFYQTS